MYILLDIDNMNKHQLSKSKYKEPSVPCVSDSTIISYVKVMADNIETHKRLAEVLF